MLSPPQFDFGGELCISGSIDRTCKIWNVKTGQCINTLRGHNDEILDVAFSANGQKLVTASADGTARVYNTMTGACQAILIGHEGEISKVSFNPQANKIITASSDRTCRVWDVESGDCLQVSGATERSACRGGTLTLTPTVTHSLTISLASPSHLPRFSLASPSLLPCRCWRDTPTRFSRPLSTTRATPSSRAARTTLAASGSAEHRLQEVRMTCCGGLAAEDLLRRTCCRAVGCNACRAWRR